MRIASVVLACAVVAGCAHPGVDLAGATRDQVLAKAGKPTREVPLAGGGTRLQYSLQPFGHEAYMVDVDAAGRVVRSRQALTAPEFQRIEPGAWTRDDVAREFGPPALVDGVASWQGSVWTYRWKEVNEPMFYWVYFDPQGVVRRAHPGMEYINAPDRD